MSATKSKPAHITVAAGDIPCCPGCLNPIVTFAAASDGAQAVLEARCHTCEVDFIVTQEAALPPTDAVAGENLCQGCGQAFDGADYCAVCRERGYREGQEMRAAAKGDGS